jgi:hypothetical protein
VEAPEAEVGGERSWVGAAEAAVEVQRVDVDLGAHLVREADLVAVPGEEVIDRGFDVF